MDKIYFVTGAAGFVGRALCRRLVSSGYTVHALVRRKDPILEKIGVKLWVGDLWNEKLLKTAIKNANIIVHCAGNPVFGNGSHYQKDNVDLTQYILDIVKSTKHRLQRFIYISTIGAIDRSPKDHGKQPLTEESPAFPVSDYGKSKLNAEHIVSNSGLPFAIVRPAMVVGGSMRSDSHFSVFARNAILNTPFAWIAWPGQFSIVHVDDLAYAIEVVSTHVHAENKTFFCAGESISVRDFFDFCRINRFRVGLSWIKRLIKPFVSWIPFSIKAMILPMLVASDDRLRELGWKPEYSAKTALAPVIAREKSRLNPSLPTEGQTVITGAASGLGRALVTRLANARRRLLLIDLDEDGLAELAATFPNCTTRVVDLSNKEDIDLLLSSPEWNCHVISELYACAGIGQRGNMQDIPTDVHLKMFAVNVLARIALTKDVIQNMQRRHFGRVVLISSSSAFQPLPYMATYAATNSALLSLGEAWSEEVAAQGVHVMTVCPGGMHTNFQRSAGVREITGERLMTPEEVVGKIIIGMQKQHTTLIISFRSLAMSMLSRILPRKTNVHLWRRLMEKMR